jgi:hypothetical protein
MSTAMIDGKPNTNAPMMEAPDVTPMKPASACNAYIACV